MATEAISGDVVHITSKAFLFAIDGDADDVIWIPLSVLYDPYPEHLEEKDDTEVEIHKWWYDKHRRRFERGN